MTSTRQSLVKRIIASIIQDFNERTTKGVKYRTCISTQIISKYRCIVVTIGITRSPDRPRLPGHSDPHRCAPKNRFLRGMCGSKSERMREREVDRERDERDPRERKASALGGCVNYLGGVYLPGDLQAGSARLIYTPVCPCACSHSETAKRVLEVKYATGCARTLRMRIHWASSRSPRARRSRGVYALYAPAHLSVNDAALVTHVTSGLRRDCTRGRTFT